MTARYTPNLWHRQVALEAEATRLIRDADRRQARAERRRPEGRPRRPEPEPLGRGWVKLGDLRHAMRGKNRS